MSRRRVPFFLPGELRTAKQSKQVVVLYLEPLVEKSFTAYNGPMRRSRDISTVDVVVCVVNPTLNRWDDSEVLVSSSRLGLLRGWLTNTTLLNDFDKA